LFKRSQIGSIYLALSDEGGQITGKYWSNSKIDRPSELSTNMDLAEQLVAQCQNLNTKTDRVVAVLDVLLRSNAHQPLEVRSKVALTHKSSFNSYTLDRFLLSE
jgi:hypothetical protein